MSLLGNYYGTPAAPVTILQGIREAVGKQTKVIYSRGADLVEGREEPRAVPLIEAILPAARMRTRKSRASRASTSAVATLLGTPVITRVDSRIAFRWDRGAPTDDLVARGELSNAQSLRRATTSAFAGPVSSCRRPRASTSWSVGANDGVRLYIDDRVVVDGWELNRAREEP